MRQFLYDVQLAMDWILSCPNDDATKDAEKTPDNNDEYSASATTEAADALGDDSQGDGDSDESSCRFNSGVASTVPAREPRGSDR